MRKYIKVLSTSAGTWKLRSPISIKEIQKEHYGNSGDRGILFFLFGEGTASRTWLPDHKANLYIYQRIHTEYYLP